MLVGVLKEVLDGENRVALIPASVSVLKKAGLGLRLSRGPGPVLLFPFSTVSPRPNRAFQPR